MLNDSSAALAAFTQIYRRCAKQLNDCDENQQKWLERVEKAMNLGEYQLAHEALIRAKEMMQLRDLLKETLDRAFADVFGNSY
jgi:phage shock protein A